MEDPFRHTTHTCHKALGLDEVRQPGVQRQQLRRQQGPRQQGGQARSHDAPTVCQQGVAARVLLGGEPGALQYQRHRAVLGGV